MSFSGMQEGSFLKGVHLVGLVELYIGPSLSSFGPLSRRIVSKNALILIQDILCHSNTVSVFFSEILLCMTANHISEGGHLSNMKKDSSIFGQPLH